MMEWLNSLPTEAALAVMAAGLIYWISSLDSRIGGLNSYIEELESRIVALEDKEEDTDLEDEDDW